MTSLTQQSVFKTFSIFYEAVLAETREHNIEEKSISITAAILTLANSIERSSSGASEIASAIAEGFNK